MRTQKVIQEFFAWDNSLKHKALTKPDLLDQAISWLRAVIESNKSTQVDPTLGYREKREAKAQLLQELQVFVPAHRHLVNLRHQRKAKVRHTALDSFRSHLFHNALRMDKGFSGSSLSNPAKAVVKSAPHRTATHVSAAWAMVNALELLQPPEPHSWSQAVSFPSRLGSAQYHDFKDESQMLFDHIVSNVELSTEQHELLKRRLLRDKLSP